jgi:HD-GYP domain-containing protein (c-di-GMP phosphodiesterase class II)
MENLLKEEAYFSNEIKFDKLMKYNLGVNDVSHMVRVAELSQMIAEALGIKDTEIIYTSGQLHDIGKAYINPTILNKQGKLTDKEFNEIKHHVYYSSYDAIINGCDIEIAYNLLLHHENYDGSGYPFGIKGKDIPIGARIIRVADVYDALTMDRPYRSKLTLSEAIEIMEKEKKNFDMEVFEAFKEYITQIQIKEVI